MYINSSLQRIRTGDDLLLTLENVDQTVQALMMLGKYSEAVDFSIATSQIREEYAWRFNLATAQDAGQVGRRDFQ